MCLSSISESYDNPAPLIETGFKEFSGTTSKPEFESFTLGKEKRVPLDKWIKAEVVDVSIGSGRNYKSGFHIYTNENELKRVSNKRQVFFRKATCVGKDGSMTVTIASEMYVPSDPNGWPPKPDEEEQSLSTRAKNAITGNA